MALSFHQMSLNGREKERSYYTEAIWTRRSKSEWKTYLKPKLLRAFVSGWQLAAAAAAGDDEEKRRKHFAVREIPREFEHSFIIALGSQRQQGCHVRS
jgi:hypothetical protein